MSEPKGGAVSSAFLSRLAARSRVRRWSRTRTVLLALLLATVVIGVGWLLLGSSVFAVRTVQVQGTTGALADQVRLHADSAVGEPLARVDLDSVANQVRSVPNVADVQVTRRWPHTLRVDITVRHPAAVTASRDGFEVVDPTGVVLSTATAPPASLPVVVVGNGLDATLADGLAVLRAAPAAVRARVRTVDVQSGQDVRLALDHGVTVRWGSPDDSAQKAAVLTALLKQKARVYDVSAPDLPTTRR